MHKCQSTFSAMESGEPEADLDIDNHGTLTGSVRIIRQCQDCGTETKEYTFDIDQEVNVGEHDEHDLSLQNESFSPTEEAQTKDRNGKPIKNSRYQKMMYGYDGTVEVKCDKCDEVVETVTLHDDIQASGMDELE